MFLAQRYGQTFLISGAYVGQYRARGFNIVDAPSDAPELTHPIEFDPTKKFEAVAEKPKHESVNLSDSAPNLATPAAVSDLPKSSRNRGKK